MSLYQASRVDSKKKKKKSSVDVRKKSSSASMRKNKTSSTNSFDFSGDSYQIKQLRRDKEKEQLMRLKANQKLALLEKLFSAKLKAMNVKLDDITDVKFDELQKRLQQTESAESRMTEELQRLQSENNYLKKKQKAMKRTSPMTKQTFKLIKNNIDEKSRNILTSDDSQELYEGIILDYSRKQKTYLQRWCKLNNDGELLFFKSKNSANATKKFDLISVFSEIEKTRGTEFQLIASTKEPRKFRTESEEETDEWVKYIKVVQYYFKVKSEQNVNDYIENVESENENENENDNIEEKQMEFETEKIRMEEVVEIEIEKESESDPFWLDVKEKMTGMDYKYIKQVIPEKDTMDPSDHKNNKWKEILWKTDYGEFELSCSVQLICYDTGKWTDDENNILFGSVSKYGVNSWGSWEKIAENLNRSVNDVMKQYSKLVSIPVKKLKKMAIARG